MWSWSGSIWQLFASLELCLGIVRFLGWILNLAWFPSIHLIDNWLTTNSKPNVYWHKWISVDLLSKISVLTTQETSLNISKMSPLRSRSCENKLFHYIVQMTCSPRTQNSIFWNTSNAADNVHTHLWQSQHIAFFDVVEIHRITSARLLFSSCNSVMKMYHTCLQKQCKLTYYIVSQG